MFRRLPLIALAGALALSLLGCSKPPTLQGPRLGDVPADFGLDRQAVSRRIVFPEREIHDRLGYFLRGDTGTASIMLTEFEGRVEVEELETLLESRAESWARSGVVFGELESVDIDGERARMWFERGERSRRLVAVIPYAETNRTWTVDFYTSVGRLQDDAFMSRHVTSFSVDPEREQRSTIHFGFFLVLAVAVVVIWYMRRQRQYRVSRKI